MSKSLIVNVGTEDITDNNTAWQYLTTDLNENTILEERREIPIREAGTFANLYCFVVSNTASVTSVLTFRKSRANTSLTVSYTSDQTGIKEDNSNTASFASTDEATWQWVIPSEVGTNTLSINALAVDFTPDTVSNCISFFCGGGTTGFSTASVTYYAPPSTCLAFVSSETEIKFRIRQSFTSTNFSAFSFSNLRTTNTTVGTRVNGNNGNQSVTYSSGQSGAKEDTSNTDSLSAGNDYNYYITTGTGTEQSGILSLVTRVVNTSGYFQLINSLASGGSVAANTIVYTGINGEMLFNTTEANRSMYPRFTFTASELGSYVSANTGASLATNITVRDNGGSSAVTVQYLAGQTGLKNDSSNTTEITSGTDEINYMVQCLDLTGGVTITWIGCLGETSGGAPPPSVAKQIPTLLLMNVG